MAPNADLQKGRDDVVAIGHGALALFNAAIVVAVIAVVVSARSGTPAIIKAAFDFLAWLVAQIVSPVTPGTPTNLSSTLAVADPGVYSNTGADNTDANATVGSGSTATTLGTGGAIASTLPAGWTSTYAPGDTYGAATQADGTVVYGYHQPGL